jgi:RHS repeat-associated protein
LREPQTRTKYSYDTLHRPLSLIYASTAPTVSTQSKYFVYDAATVNGVAMQGSKTRLVEAYTKVSTSKITDEGLSYTARGELSDFYELTPHSPTSYYHVSQTYWPNGAPNVLSGNLTVGIPNITYGVDGEGRTSATSASSGQNPVASTTYNVHASPYQLTIALGSGDSDVATYDPNTFRMNKYQFNIGSQTVTGTLSWNPNGSLSSLGITDPFSTANTQSCTFAADDLARISTVNCGAIWGQNFSYDPFGNIQKTAISGTGATTFNPTYQSSPSYTNRVAAVNGVSTTYDANGNSLNDTFRTFTWDVDNNPATIGPVNVTYDAFDRPVEESIGGTISEVVYSPGGVKLALMNGPSLTNAFVPLTGSVTAVYNSGGLAYYRHGDHLGSSRFASTPSRTLYSDIAYSPFGEPYATSGSIDRSFTGQNQDATLGLYDFLYREYDPNQARWTSPDPAGIAAVELSDPQSFNRYTYVRNRPLRYVDRLGLTCYARDGDGNITDNIPDSDIDNADDCEDAGDFGGFWIDNPHTVVIVDENGIATFGGDAVDPERSTPQCIEPSPFQRVGISIQHAAASLTGLTIGVGAGVSGTGGYLMGINYTASRQIVVSPNGEAAFTTTLNNPKQGTWNAVTARGVGGYGGFQVSASFAQTPQDLADDGIDYGAGGGKGWGGGLDLSLGRGTKGQPVGSLTFTGGVGGGIPPGIAHGFTITTTKVDAICGGG